MKSITRTILTPKQSVMCSTLNRYTFTLLMENDMPKVKALPPTKLPPRDLIYKHLRNGVANFKFIKANGEEREMNATLITAKMDPRLVPDTNPNPPTQDPDVFKVWDIDSKGWRQFKISSLTEYNGKVSD